MGDKLSCVGTETSIAVSPDLLKRLSPLQQKILVELATGPLGLKDLSEKTGSSVYTIGKQLSILQCRTKCNALKLRGISEPLVKKSKEPGVKTTYFLSAQPLHRL